MATETPSKSRTRQRPRNAAAVGLGTVVRRTLKEQGSEFVFPTLTGAEAALLMKATGIITPTGKLKKSYQ